MSEDPHIACLVVLAAARVVVHTVIDTLMVQPSLAESLTDVRRLITARASGSAGCT